MKTCKACHQEKELSKFHKAPTMKDNRSNKCKECVKIYDAKRFQIQSKIPQVLEARKAYNKTPSRRISNNKSRNKHRAKYQKAEKARAKLNNNILSGKISRSDNCETCPSSIKIEAHHDDYSKPLDIRWLCRKCHMLWHRNNTPLNRE